MPWEVTILGLLHKLQTPGSSVFLQKLMVAQRLLRKPSDVHKILLLVLQVVTSLQVYQQNIF